MQATIHISSLILGKVIDMVGSDNVTKLDTEGASSVTISTVCGHLGFAVVPYPESNIAIVSFINMLEEDEEPSVYDHVISTGMESMGVVLKFVEHHMFGIQKALIATEAVDVVTEALNNLKENYNKNKRVCECGECHN